MLTVSEPAERSVAGVAEKSSNLPCRMAVVDLKAMMAAWFRRLAAKPAKSFLLLDHLFVLFQVQAIATKLVPKRASLLLFFRKRVPVATLILRLRFPVCLVSLPVVLPGTISAPRLKAVFGPLIWSEVLLGFKTR